MRCERTGRPLLSGAPPAQAGGTMVGGEGIEPPTWSLGRGIAQFPVRFESGEVGALVSALKTPKHRLMPIRTVSRCKWLTQNARETSLGSANPFNSLSGNRQLIVFASPTFLQLQIFVGRRLLSARRVSVRVAAETRHRYGRTHSMTVQGCDLVGDIHGHADALLRRARVDLRS